MLKQALLITGFLLLWVAYGVGQPKKILDTLPARDLEEVVISATRFPEKKKFVQQQVQVISSQKIAQLNQPNTALMLEQTGNVFVQKSQLGGGSPVMRGFEANKVLLVVDGVRMNNAIYRGGHLQNSITVDASMLEKMELLFGAGSVMYGSDALGGVIHYFTKKPSLSEELAKTQIKGNAFVRYASAYGEKSVHADVSIGGRKWGSLTSVTYSDFEDLQQGSKYYDDYPDWGPRTFYVQRVNGIDSMMQNNDPESQKFTGYSQFDLVQKVLFKPSDKSEHLLNIQYSTSSNIPRYDRLILTRNNLPRFAEWYYGPQDRFLASYQYMWKGNKWFDEARLQTSYQRIEESRYDRAFRDDLLQQRIETVSVAAVNADFIRKKGKGEWRYGAEVNYNNVQSEASGKNIQSGELTALDTRYPDGGSFVWSGGIYLSYLNKLSEELILNAGGRLGFNYLQSTFTDQSFFPFPYDQIQQTSFPLSASIGSIWMPANGWRFTTGIATGFRTPNVDDVAKVFESVPGRIILPNPNLKPEKTITAEASIQKNFGKRSDIQLTGFYTWYWDALTVDKSTYEGLDSIPYNGITSGVYTTVNKDRAYLLGSNLQFNLQLLEGLTAKATLNYTFARIITDTSDYPLDHIPPVHGFFGLTWQSGKFQVEGYSLFQGEKASRDYNLRGEDNQQYSANPVKGYTPSWATLNVRMQWQITSEIQIQAGIENLLDKYYRVFASGLSASGRNFVGALRVRI